MANLTRLASFVAVADELNFGRAARRLNISQPALSQQIATLEQELGAQLLIRSSRQVTLTPAGMQTLSDARDLLSRANQLEVRARNAAQGGRGYLALGFSMDYLEGPLARLLAGIHERHDGVHIQSRLDVSPVLADDVASERLDIAFVTPPLPSHSKALATFDLPAVDIVGVLRSDHHAADSDTIDLTALADEPFVLPRSNMWNGFYMQLTALFDEAGFVPDIVHEVENTSMLIKLVTEGVGVAVATQSSVDLASPGLVFPRLTGSSAQVRQAVIWHQDNRSPVLHEILDTLQTRPWGSTTTG